MTPSGDWQVRAAAPQGRFAGCEASVQVQNNGLVTLQRRPDGQTVLILRHPQLNLPLDQLQDVRADFDGRGQQRLTATAPQAQVALIAVDNAFLDGFARGSRMNLDIGGRRVSLALRGTGTMVQDLRTCVQTQGRGTAQAQAQQAQPAPQEPVQSTGPVRPQPAVGVPGGAPPIAAARFQTILPIPLIEILVRAGLAEATPVILDNVPPRERPGEFVWQYGSITGAVTELPIPRELGFEEASRRFSGDLRGSCTEEPQFALSEVEAVGEIQLRVGTMQCRLRDGDGHFSLLFYQSGQTLTRFMHFGPIVLSAQADRARDGIRTVITERARELAARQAGQPNDGSGGGAPAAPPSQPNPAGARPPAQAPGAGAAPR